jgi:AmmeMemoRadiSam system protein B/AmmeMemoRadiSam system protein A
MFKMKQIIRKPYCAGTWYSSNANELRNELKKYLENTGAVNNKAVKAIIVPHAGYMYSGQVAAYAFKSVPENIKEVIILGTAHHYYLKGVAASDYDNFETPLGKIPVSKRNKSFKSEKNISVIPEADTNEHSIEIELPFLQCVLKDFSIIPLYVGKIDYKEFSSILEKYLSDKTLIVVSVDLSHFHNYDKAVTLDKYTTTSIEELDSEKIKEAEIDSPYAVMALLELAKKLNWKPELLKYANSGDVTGDKSRVVGYSAFIFTEQRKNENQFIFTELDIEYMESLAKQSVESFIGEGKKLRLKSYPDKFNAELACFVTLKIKKDLRGCIGTIEPNGSLWDSIIENAISAATKDWRFSPVRKDELKDLSYEVSVLSKPEQLFYSSEEELLREIKNKGVIISKGQNRALYLPQVWEHFSNPADFLSSLCQKGNMNKAEWRSGNLEVFVFENLN